MPLVAAHAARLAQYESLTVPAVQTSTRSSVRCRYRPRDNAIWPAMPKRRRRDDRKIASVVARKAWLRPAEMCDRAIVAAAAQAFLERGQLVLRGRAAPGIIAVGADSLRLWGERRGSRRPRKAQTRVRRLQTPFFGRRADKWRKITSSTSYDCRPVGCCAEASRCARQRQPPATQNTCVQCCVTCGLSMD